VDNPSPWSNFLIDVVINGQPTPNMNNSEASSHYKVQCKLGRCMLRLQQYERLLKLMVASMAVDGGPEQLQATRDEQVMSVNKKSLGVLVALFVDSHLIRASLEYDAELADIDRDEKSRGTAWVRMRCTIECRPSNWRKRRQTWPGSFPCAMTWFIISLNASTYPKKTAAVLQPSILKVATTKLTRTSND
jgi:hypothetical protein